MAFNAEHIKWFRDSAPYIDAHRDRTFVLCLPDSALQSQNLNNLIKDVALLNALDVRLALVFDINAFGTGARGDIGLTQADMDELAAEHGKTLNQLVSLFSASTPDSPLKKLETIAISGNFIKARPLGIINGIDQQHRGAVRGVNVSALQHQLAGSAIVLIPATGYSPSGEQFSVEVESVATEVAAAVQADKLIFMVPNEGLLDGHGSVINEIDLSVHPIASVSDYHSLLDYSELACSKGVSRCHVISHETDGAILEELFTRDGCGTQIADHSYEQIRGAGIDDVSGIVRLIAPLEEKGILVKRSREKLEDEIENFTVIERDGLLIACAALYCFDNAAELACLVTHPDYRNSDRGDRLLDSLCKQAHTKHIDKIFALTTQSEHWFMERGFVAESLDCLPIEKQSLYNYQRSSKILVKALT